MNDKNIQVLKDALHELLTEANNKDISADEWLETQEKIDNLILSLSPLIQEDRDWMEELNK